MRRDRQLFEAVDMDRENERNQSGCCVRLDDSGCVQEPNNESCLVRRLNVSLFICMSETTIILVHLGHINLVGNQTYVCSPLM